MAQKIKDKLGSIPISPGVYFFKNKKDKIIYIGKAKSLKKRVGSYFNKKKYDIKTRVMVKHIHDIDFLIVKSWFKTFLPFRFDISTRKPYPMISPSNILISFSAVKSVTSVASKSSIILLFFLSNLIVFLNE